MDEIKIFKNAEFGQIRTVEENGNILFCGSDIAKALGYDQPHKAVERHCKKDGGTFRTVIDSLGREQQAKFITEGDLYRLITNSKLPSAEKFESWIFDEVLPTIRKTGGYVSNDDLFINTYLPNADEQTKLMFKSQLSVIKNLNGKIEQDKPKVIFADAVSVSSTSVSVADMAKLLKQNGINTGQQRFFEWLRSNGYLIRRKGTDYNAPTQRSMELKLFETKETSITHSDGHITVKKTPKVTGKGQIYFINKFKEIKGGQACC